MLLAKILFTFLFLGIVQAQQWRHWQNGNRGNSPHSQILAVNSGKLFFVADGDLWENYWVGGINSQWKWWNHGRPSKNEALATMKPCAIGHKVFVISRSGQLYERYYRTGSFPGWQWVAHWAPTGQPLKPTGCATISSPHHGVYAVGEDRQLYERTFTTSWVWMSHQHLPNSEQISDASIDTFDCAGCGGSVHVVTLKGKFYTLPYNVLGNVGSWQTNHFPLVQSIAATHTIGGGLFFVTRDNQVCEENPLTSSYHCYGRPTGTTSSTTERVTISRPLRITNCAGLANGRYLFVNSWSSVTGRRGRVTLLHIINTPWSPSNSQYSYEHITGISQDYIGAPEMVPNGNCPKGYDMRDNGLIDQFAWH